MYTQTSKVLKGTDERLQKVVTIAENKWTPIVEMLVPMEARLQSWLDTPPPAAPAAAAPPAALAATAAAQSDGSFCFGDDSTLIEEDHVRPARPPCDHSLPTSLSSLCSRASEPYERAHTVHSQSGSPMIAGSVATGGTAASDQGGGRGRNRNLTW